MSYPHHYGSDNRPPSYGPGPNAQPVYPPHLGYRIDAPLYMPTPGYPQSSSSPYPPSSSSTSYQPPSMPYPSPSSALYPSASSAPYPSASSAPYPSASSAPYPPSNSSPYPPSNSSPYPPSNSTPYPPTNSSPYPPSNSSPYPSSNSRPYPPSNSSPYPPSNSSRYPSSNSSPYPSSNSSPYPPSNSSPYPSVTSRYPAPYSSSAAYPKSSSSYPSHTSPPYPNLNQSNPRTSHQTHYQSSSASYPTSQHSRSSVHTNMSTSYPSSGATAYKGTPTVTSANPFNPREDAEKLRKAMKGFGTDEKTIISVLSKRTNAQRLQISVEFKTLYGKDLIKDLKSETSGKFEDLLVALMTPLPYYYAKELHDAIVGLGTDEEVLIEVLCTKTNNEIKTIRHAYHSIYNKPLEDDLRGDTSGTFKRLMVSLCNAGRDESMMTNQAQAAEDARSLLQAGELRFGTDESTFNMILCQRSYAQLRLIFEEYYKITGHDFEQAIKNEFSGNSKDCMLAIVRSIRNLPGFFAKCLHDAIAGLGTNDRTLIRVVVTRCEIDMGNIKQNYLAQYGETLADAIKGDTSGDYKKLLLALIAES